MSETTHTQITPSGAPVGASSHAAPSTCCGGPAPANADACCAKDAEVKSSGGTGCGCGSAPAQAAPAASTGGCCG